MVQDATETLPPAPRLRLLRIAFLPLNVYVRLDVPLPPAARPGLSNERLGLHLVGWTEPGSPSDGFAAATALPPPAGAMTPRPRVRKVLALLSCPEAPLGRYRVALVRDGETVAEANVARRANRVRPLTPDPPEPARSITPVLISGTPKSGTTWIEKVVNAHPDFLVLHEANTLRMISPEAIGQDIERRREFFRTRYIPWMPLEHEARDFGPFLQISLARALMESLGRAWGARYVADRTPGYADLYPYLEGFWEDVRVLHIVRHPLDVMTSWLFHEAKAARDPRRPLRMPRQVVEGVNTRLDAGRAIPPGGYVSDAAVADGAFNYCARVWRADQLAVRRAAEDSPDQFHVLTYEALTADFPAMASRVFAFLGTDPARTDLSRIERDASFRTLSGGREPGIEDARNFFRKGIVGDWSRVLSDTQANMIWAELADAAAAFGYTMDQTGARQAA